MRMAEVEIYSSMLCGYCYRAKKLLEMKGVPYQEVDVMLHPKRRREMIDRAGGRTSVPQIFINGDHIGGSEDLFALESAGRLDALLAAEP